MILNKVKNGINRSPLLSAIFLPLKKAYWQVLHQAMNRAIRRRFQSREDFRKMVLRMSFVPGATFVKVGANDGISGDPCSDILLANSNWRGLLIEPVPYCCDRLRKNFSDASRFSIAQVAIGPIEGKRTFYYVGQSASENLPALPPWYDQLGSFNKNHIVKRFGLEIAPYIVESEVTTCTLPDVLAQYKIGQVDLLHVDTEGYDLEILKMVDFERCVPQVIFIEHRHLSRENRREMLRVLRKNNYLVRDCGHDYYALNQAARVRRSL